MLVNKTAPRWPGGSLLIVAACQVWGCASLLAADKDAAGLSARLDRIEKQLDKEEKRLSQVKGEIVEQRWRLLEAQHDAAVAECKATVARIDAEVAGEVSKCAWAHTQFEKCVADFAKRQSNQDWVLCLIAGGAALATGGVSLGAAAGVCGKGMLASKALSMVQTSGCSKPGCDPHDEAPIRRWVLEQRGLPEEPKCDRVAAKQPTNAVR